MKSQQFRQGEVVVQRIADDTSCGAEIAPGSDGRLILAHSETGHHHFVSAKMARLFESGEPGVRICTVGAGGAALEHARLGGHTTETLSPGTYRISQKRQYTPEGWEPVRD